MWFNVSKQGWFAQVRMALHLTVGGTVFQACTAVVAVKANKAKLTHLCSCVVDSQHLSCCAITVPLLL
jgi:hypothetical protein